MFTLVLETGQTLRGVAEQVEPDELGSMWGKRSMVTGRAIFRPSGAALRIEAEAVREADEKEASLWSAVPRPALAPTDLRSVRVPQGARTGINAVWGHWPGDESDEQFEAALEELS